MWKALIQLLVAFGIIIGIMLIPQKAYSQKIIPLPCYVSPFSQKEITKNLKESFGEFPVFIAAHSDVKEAKIILYLNPKTKSGSIIAINTFGQVCVMVAFINLRPIGETNNGEEEKDRTF